MIDRAHRHSPRTAAAPEPAGEKSNVFREGNPCEVQYEAVPHSPSFNDPMIDALFSPDDRYEERAADVLGKIVSLNPKGGRAQEKVMGLCCACGADRDRAGQRYCRSCHAKWMRENRPKHRELGDVARAAANCRSYANVYQNRGLLARQACECEGDDCSGKVEKHHDDYDKPLEVRWLCRAHHLRLHDVDVRRGTVVACVLKTEKKSEGVGDADTRF